MDDLISKLKSFDYFKFVPENQMEDVVRRVGESYSKDKTVGAPINPEAEDTYRDLIDKCFDGTRRFYNADAENVGEGGMSSIINTIAGLQIFQLENIPTPVIQKPNGINDDVLTLVVGNSQYTLWDGTKTANSFAKGSEIVSTFCKSLNDFCQKNGQSSRFFVQYSGGNDQKIVLLTNEIYSFLSSLNPKKDWLPINVS